MNKKLSKKLRRIAKSIGAGKPILEQKEIYKRLKETQKRTKGQI